MPLLGILHGLPIGFNLVKDLCETVQGRWIIYAFQICFYNKRRWKNNSESGCIMQWAAGHAREIFYLSRRNVLISHLVWRFTFHCRLTSGVWKRGSFFLTSPRFNSDRQSHYGRSLIVGDVSSGQIRHDCARNANGAGYYSWINILLITRGSDSCPSPTRRLWWQIIPEWGEE